LRNRQEDIHLIFRKFAHDFAEKYRMPAIKLDEEAVQLLINYPWPGNIRELENVIHRALLVSQDGRIQNHDLHLPVLVDTEHTQNKITQKITQVSESKEESNFLDSSTYDTHHQWKLALECLLKQAPDNLFEFLLETIIKEAYNHCNQNQVQTARLLGITRNVLRTYLKKFGFITSDKNDTPEHLEELVSL
jgi:sigma-54-specific transcriptional regulator